MTYPQQASELASDWPAEVAGSSPVRVAKVLVLSANLFVCHTYWWATTSKIFVGLVAQLVRAND